MDNPFEIASILFQFHSFLNKLQLQLPFSQLFAATAIIRAVRVSSSLQRPYPAFNIVVVAVLEVRVQRFWFWHDVNAIYYTL